MNKDMKKIAMNNNVRVFIFLLNIVSLVYILLAERSLGNDAIDFVVAIMTFSAVLCVTKRTNTDIKFNKRSCVGAFFLAILFGFQLSISEVVYSQCIQRIPFTIRWLFVILLFFDVFIMIYYVIWRVLNTDNNDLVPMENKEFFVYGVILIIETALFVFSTFPAIWLQADTAGVWDSATNDRFSDWHTIGYVLFVFLCSLIYKSEFSVIIIQSIVWIILNLYILKFWGGIGKKYAKLYLYILTFSFLIFNYLENMGKDTTFAMGVLALTAVIIKILYSERIEYKDIFMFAIVPLFALLFRHGGVIVVVVADLSLIAYLCCKKNYHVTKKVLGVLFFHIIMFLLVNVFLMNILNVTKNPAYVKYGTPMAMVGAAVQRGNTFDDEDKEVLEKVMPLEEWANCYNKYWADDISRSWGKIGDRIYIVQQMVDEEDFGIQLLKINLKLFLRHPKTYIISLFDMNSIIWEMAKPSDAPVYTICQVPEDENIRYSIAYRVTSEVVKFVDSYSITRAIFTRGGFALFIVIFSGIIVWIKKQYRYLIATIPILLVNAMLLITVPSQDPRYILPSLECAIVIFVMSMAIGKVK